MRCWNSTPPQPLIGSLRPADLSVTSFQSQRSEPALERAGHRLNPISRLSHLGAGHGGLSDARKAREHWGCPTWTTFPPFRVKLGFW